MKTKHLLLAIMLMVGSLTLSAQEKNQYMVIEFNYQLKKEIQISIDGKQYLEEEADYSPASKSTHNANPLLKKVSKYESEGWELMYFHSMSQGTAMTPVYIAYLKKKK